MQSLLIVNTLQKYKVYIYINSASSLTKTNRKLVNYSEFGPGLMLLNMKDVDAFPERMLAEQLSITISPSYWWSIIDQRNKKSGEKLPQGMFGILKIITAAIIFKMPNMPC